MKPKNASGSRKAASAEPTWIAPKTSPVRIAAGHGPFQLRSAPKKKPRKKNSSAIGATTATRKATASSAKVLSLTPSSSGSLVSSGLTPRIDTHTSVKT